MDIGQLRHRITILQPAADRDAGGQLRDPLEFKTRWAAIEPMSGQQLYRAQQFVSDANTQVTLRYTDGVLPKMTVAYGTRTFVILYVVNEQERNVKLTLFCKEIL